jgi:hypothetical protein
MVAQASPSSAPQPVVEGESVARVTQNDATLEAKIDPESQDHYPGVYYQFQLVKNPSEYLPDLVCSEWGVVQPLGHHGCLDPPGDAPSGFIPLRFLEGGSEGRAVSQSLGAAGITLEPGTTYHYRVLAARAKVEEDTTDWELPVVAGSDQTFTTPPAGSTPAIDGVSVSHLTPTDAMLEAQIDSEGLSTSYEFRLWSSPCSHHSDGCEFVVEIPLPTGLLLGSFVDQGVSLDLNSVGVTLGGGEYGFSVRATSAAGSTVASGGTFEAPEGVFEPLHATTSPSSDTGQPDSSYGGGQPSGSTGSSAPVSSHATPGLAPGPKLGTLGFSAHRSAQKLAKALKACERKPKGKRAACKKQARRRYGAKA